MSRVVCVFPPFFRLTESKNNRVTPAIHYLAEVLHRRGHEVLYLNADHSDVEEYADRFSITMNNWLYDERIRNGHKSFDEAMDVIKEFRPDFVVIGAGDILLPTVDIGSSDSCAKMASLVKAWNPDCVTVGYGHQLRTAKPEHVSALDAIIQGEGEEDVVEIVENGVRGVLPIRYRADMDSLPILTGSYLHHEVTSFDWDYIMSMRGCPFKCTFCFQPSLRGSKIKMMSPQRFVSEVRHRIVATGTTGFYFSDMIFGLTKKRTLEMCRLLTEVKAECEQFHWWCEARVDTVVDEEMAEAMALAGCSHLKFGVEMANNQMLKVIQKGIDLNKIQIAFERAAAFGIKRTAYVLLGCPGFTDQDYQDMWQFFSSLCADHYVININVPYRGTKLYQMLEADLHKAGLFKDGEEGFTHTSEAMQKFWGISDKTIKMYFSLEGVKDDTHLRMYRRKVVDRPYFKKTGKIRYHTDEELKGVPELLKLVGSDGI